MTRAGGLRSRLLLVGRPSRPGRRLRGKAERGLRRPPSAQAIQQSAPSLPEITAATSSGRIRAAGRRSRSPAPPDRRARPRLARSYSSAGRGGPGACRWGSLCASGGAVRQATHRLGQKPGQLQAGRVAPRRAAEVCMPACRRTQLGLAASVVPRPAAAVALGLPPLASLAGASTTSASEGGDGHDMRIARSASVASRLQPRGRGCHDRWLRLRCDGRSKEKAVSVGVSSPACRRSRRPPCFDGDDGETGTAFAARRGPAPL